MLVDVGEDTITLAKTLSLPQPIKYIALSYCWGDAEFLNLTQASGLAIPGKHIPFAELPRDFRHGSAP